LTFDIASTLPREAVMSFPSPRLPTVAFGSSADEFGDVVPIERNEIAAAFSAVHRSAGRNHCLDVIAAQSNGPWANCVDLLETRRCGNRCGRGRWFSCWSGSAVSRPSPPRTRGRAARRRQSVHELRLPTARRRIPPAHESGRRRRLRQPRVARAERHLSVRICLWDRDRRLRCDDRAAPLAPASRSRRPGSRRRPLPTRPACIAPTSACWNAVCECRR
jgi:hypothetical protein